MTCTCDGNPTGVYLCASCDKTLAYALLAVADFHEELGTIRAKMTRFGNGSTKGSIGKTVPAPIDLRFASCTDEGQRLLDDSRATVVAWSRTVMDEQDDVTGPLCGAPCLHTSCNTLRIRRHPRDTVRSMCAYLDRQHRWISGREYAPALMDEMRNLEGRLRRMVNPPQARWSAGFCECGAELRMLVGRSYTRCQCGITHSADERREYLLSEAEHMLVTASEAAGALSAWTDYDGSVSDLMRRISDWGRRGQVLSRGNVTVSGQERPAYRLGDIREQLEADARRKALATIARARKRA